MNISRFNLIGDNKIEYFKNPELQIAAISKIKKKCDTAYPVRPILTKYCTVM